MVDTEEAESEDALAATGGLLLGPYLQVLLLKSNSGFGVDSLSTGLLGWGQ